jgi:hypothetical protein
VTPIANSYIGSSSQKFIKYLKDVLKISIQDIMNKYPQLKLDKVKFQREKKSELMYDLRHLKLGRMNDNQQENIKLFLLDMNEDETTTYLLWLLDEEYDIDNDEKQDKVKNEFILSFLKDKRFKKYHARMYGNISNK